MCASLHDPLKMGSLPKIKGCCSFFWGMESLGHDFVSGPRFFFCPQLLFGRHSGEIRKKKTKNPLQRRCCRRRTRCWRKLCSWRSRRKRRPEVPEVAWFDQPSGAVRRFLVVSLWCILPRAVRTLTFCQRIWVFQTKPLKVRHCWQGFADFATEL